MKLEKKAPIVRQIAKTTPDKLYRILSLKEFYDKRENILICRNVGGLGDILMHRMLFEDFKLAMPNCKVHFACPAHFHIVVKDHPFIDGNKRVGCFVFLLYLQMQQVPMMLDDKALTALALLVAESDPLQKDILIRLIVNLLH